MQMKLEKETLERFELAAHTISYRNCIGTALYVLGIKETDMYVGKLPKSSPWIQLEDDIVDQYFTKVTEPVIGGVLVLRGGRYHVSHIAIVRDIDPVVLFHRRGFNKDVIPYDTLDDVLEYYAPFGGHEFYVKKKQCEPNEKKNKPWLKDKEWFKKYDELVVKQLDQFYEEESVKAS